MSERQSAIELLQGLVAIPSLSTRESMATNWLAQQMRALGYDRAYVDEAGNAVGEMGETDAAHTIVLLGHIDTVPGNIPVRIEKSEGDELLYGRGSVDAKGPLATFGAAVSRVGAQFARDHNIRIVVVGAVEEEAASSKGARHIARRFDGANEPIPSACIIGEPSSWRRVTLGYKGRLLAELDAAQPMAHTAGPDAGVATVAVDFWNWIWDYATRFNVEHTKIFDQLLPSLRQLSTTTDDQMNDRVFAQSGIRLPPAFDVEVFVRELTAWLAQRINAPLDAAMLAAHLAANGLNAPRESLHLAGENTSVDLRLRGYEPAWQSDRNNALVRSFLGAIRQIDPNERPGFVSKTGTSDMNVVGPLWQCPILAYGPGDSTLDHTPNEHISLDEYWRAVLVLEQALRNWAVANAL
ncbi:MAG: M20/M25/M40 family metallo-hydrolase [Caldilineaceae bacterium]|nr:M20/M25/M40 family metallo-hydrolase [Caldilineaceae bacterium]